MAFAQLDDAAPAELVSTALAVLHEVVPQLNAEEQLQVARQHPFATAAWLQALTAACDGRLSEDLLLMADLERELRLCQGEVHEREQELAHAREQLRELNAALQGAQRAVAVRQSFC